MEVVQEAASDVQIPILLMGKAKPEEFNVDRQNLPAIPTYEKFDEGYDTNGDRGPPKLSKFSVLF